tara:strand:+ start:1072 stop:2133 length:1062 start_codon:yes stop_codon:yes gene_type:complete
MTMKQKQAQTTIPSMALKFDRPVVAWAMLGALLFVFEWFVLGSWVFGSNFVPTDPGLDEITRLQEVYFLVLQIAVPLVCFICLYVWVLVPWRRDGHLNSDALLALAAAMIFFWDMCMNYTSVQLLYNSNMINFGAWANDAWPSWTSPNAHLLPEPIFVTIPGYTCMVFGQVVFICWLLRQWVARRPNTSTLEVIGLIVFGLFVIDSSIEVLLIRTGVYAYPGGIRELTLFAGETYQFPLTEGFLFGGLGLGAMAVLKFFKDDRGQTFVEKGSERLKLSPIKKQWVRFFAIFGFCHGVFLVLYMVPNQWLATHSDPFPENYPSYMLNGMCVSGVDEQQCPGPGVAMPRPMENPL